MLIVILVILGWLIHGILAQGMCRHNLAQKNSKPQKELLYLLLLLGPFNLIVATIISHEDQTWGLKF